MHCRLYNIQYSVLVFVFRGDLVAHLEIWWLIGSAPDFWGRGPGFESGTSHYDSDALQDHCEIL